MKQVTAVVLLAAMMAGCATGEYPLPAVLKLEPNPEYPDVLTTFDKGEKVRYAQDWNRTRRPELKRLFQHYMYGFMPAAPKIVATVDRTDPAALDGKATLKEITIRFGPEKTPPIHLLLVVPNNRGGPAPTFLGLNFTGNHTVLSDPGITLPTTWMRQGGANDRTVVNNRATEAGRGTAVDTWAIAQTIDAGYAVATFYYGDTLPDRGDFGPDSVVPYFLPAGQTQPAPTDWGGIAIWAWSLHRAVDYLVTDRDIDARRIAVFGHSRNGKAALLAGAFDDRIALVIPHQSGTGGAAPSRHKVGETVKQINDRFPHWFNDVFPQFNDNVDLLPFDQHCLIALCAPRPVLLTNAVDDQWADPAGQFQMLTLADPVYHMLGVEGVASRQMPEVGKLMDSRLGYWIRPGKHSTTPEDWKTFVAFANRHMRKR